MLSKSRLLVAALTCASTLTAAAAPAGLARKMPTGISFPIIHSESGIVAGTLKIERIEFRPSQMGPFSARAWTQPCLDGLEIEIDLEQIDTRELSTLITPLARHSGLESLRSENLTLTFQLRGAPLVIEAASGQIDAANQRLLLSDTQLKFRGENTAHARIAISFDPSSRRLNLSFPNSSHRVLLL